MKRIKKFLLDSIQSFDGSKRMEEMEGWKELADGIIYFMLLEIVTIFFSVAVYDFSFFCIFTMINFFTNMVMTIIGAIIIFMKKRRSHFNNTEPEDSDYGAKRFEAWCCEHPPWM